MAFLIYTLGLLLSPNFVVGNFSYDGSRGPSNWGKEYKTCLGKHQSPIDIEEKDVTNATYPPLQFSDIEGSHTAYMTNDGHTVKIRSFDSNVPTISGGPLNDTYIFHQLHFHWGQSDNLGSEDLINNHSFSMELHAVFWKKEYGSSDEAMKKDDGLTVLAYLYQATDKNNPAFDSIVQQIPDIAGVGSNVTINDSTLLSKLIAPDIASAQDYFTYKGSLTTPPCLEIVQWIDFEKPQYISHAQLNTFRSIQSSDGTNLTHNFRPVQPLDDRIVYRNIAGPEVPSTTSGAASTTITSETTVPSASETTTSTPTTINSPTPSTTTTTMAPTPTEPSKKPETTTASTTKQTSTETTSTTSSTVDKKNKDSGQHSIWTASPFAVIVGIIFLLPYQ